MIAVARATALALAAASCTSALHEPAAVATMAPGHANGRTPDELVRAGDVAWARRDEHGQVAAALDLYLDAAAADERRVDAILGAMKALSLRIENEAGVPREKLAEQEVDLGQWCQRRAPANRECDYRLAIALGQQARERPSTGKDALDKLVGLLHRAIAGAPRLDAAGPHRVLALVLLRAPSWPLGPGDPDAALAEARTAVQLFPDAPENQLVLAEALAATDAGDAARAAYTRALALATAARDSGDPDAADRISDARAGLARTAER